MLDLTIVGRSSIESKTIIKEFIATKNTLDYNSCNIVAFDTR